MNLNLRFMSVSSPIMYLYSISGFKVLNSVIASGDEEYESTRHGPVIVALKESLVV